MSAVHDWLRPIHLFDATSATTRDSNRSPLLAAVLPNLLAHFEGNGHQVQPQPNAQTDLILTTAAFGENVGWRDALMFTARKRYNLESSPTVFTFISATPAQLNEKLDYFQAALAKNPPDPADFTFPGLAPNAYHTLIEQGLRGGPIMALVRLLQSQSKSIRIVLVIGEDRPISAYYFDLVGANRQVLAQDPDTFYDDMVARLVTSVSTREVTQHIVESPSIAQSLWRSSPTPASMSEAARLLGRRHFFTEMVRVADLVHVPALQGAISSQYSEGCFATWDPLLNGLVTTITGSARPVDKDSITEDDLAIITGVRPDGLGALVRHVDGKRNDPPSSEALELRDMDFALPTLTLGSDWGPWAGQAVPVTRSKLHGHRGVGHYHPDHVEFVALDTPYYHYPVSCATQAQAKAIKAAFGRSQALNNPQDPRQVVFTVLPGHGLVMVEKWVAGKAPFQLLWEYMDAGWIQVDNVVPQGLLQFVSDSATGNYVLQDDLLAELLQSDLA